MKPTTCVLFSLFVFSANAQTAAGPVLGWSLTQDGRAIRTVLGIPGASGTGPVSNLPDDIAMVSINPASNLALALAGDNLSPVILNLTTGERTTLTSARPNPDLVVWSPAGSALGFFYKEAQWVQVFTLQAGGFQLSTEFTAAAMQAAVADDGSAVLGLSDAGLSLYTASSAAVLSAAPVTAFTFIAKSTTPAFWTGGQLTIGSQSVAFSIDNSEQLMLASPAEHRVLAIRSGAGQVSAFGDNAQLLDQATCNCPVSGIAFVGRPGTVRLDGARQGPLWLVDDSSQLRVFFVPLPQPEVEISQD